MLQYPRRRVRIASQTSRSVPTLGTATARSHTDATARALQTLRASGQRRFDRVPARTRSGATGAALPGARERPMCPSRGDGHIHQDEVPAGHCPTEQHLPAQAQFDSRRTPTFSTRLREHNFAVSERLVCRGCGLFSEPTLPRWLPSSGDQQSGALHCKVALLDTVLVVPPLPF